MTALAVAPLRRRALERKGMTPEEEMDLLIREQQADDTYQVFRPEGQIGFDDTRWGEDHGGEHGSTGVTLANLFGVDIDGNLQSFYRRAARGVFDSQRTQHGTIYGYRRLACRCVKCKSAQAAAVREYRRRKNSDG